MTFDFGEVLSRAWQITWKNSALWVIGFAFFIHHVSASPSVICVHHWI